MPGLRRQRDVQAHHVRLGEEHVEVGDEPRRTCVATGVVEHPHAEALGAARHGPADAPVAHEAQGGAMHVAPEVLVDAPAVPAPGANVTLRLRQQARCGQDQGEREIRGGLVEHARRVAHRDAPRGRGGDVDVVEPHGHVPDHLEPTGAGIDHAGVDAIRQQADDCVDAGHGGHQLLVRERAVVVALHQLVPVERVEPALGKESRDEDACHRPDSSSRRLPTSLDDGGGRGDRDRSEMETSNARTRAR